MLSQANDPVYMENYFGWAFEFLKNYLIWEKSLTIAKEKLNSIRNQKQFAVNRQKENLERISELEGKIQYLAANPSASANVSNAYSNSFQEKIAKGKQNEKKKTKKIVLLVIGAILGIDLLIFLGIGLLSALSIDTNWKDILISFAGLLFPLLPLLIIIGIAAIIFFAYKGKKHKPNAQDFATERRRQLGRYEDTVVELKNENVNCHRNYEQLNVEEPVAERNLQDVEKCYSQAREILKKHYSIDVVPGASRELLLDLDSLRLLRYYLAAGICTDVLGADGIYALYRREIREDRKHEQIMGILNEIRSGIDDIRDNQATLIGEVQRMNSTMSGIQSSLNNISQDVSEIRTNSAISAAAEMQTAANTNYMRGVAYDAYMRRSW